MDLHHLQETLTQEGFNHQEVMRDFSPLCMCLKVTSLLKVVKNKDLFKLKLSATRACV